MENEIGNRAALYCRVSTEDQAKEGYSLSAQKERLMAYCKAKGWEVSKIYVDDGYSGRYSDRPAYTRMMKEKEQWDILVVLKMDRVHRNSKNFTLMMERLKEWGKEFTSMQESFDTTTAMGRFVMDIIQRIAQLESEQIGERVYFGMRQKAKEGKGILGFNIPYGFDMVPNGVRVNEEEKMNVALIFNYYAKGGSVRDVCSKLEEEGIRTKKGLDKWDPKTVYRILTNPIYIGYHVWDDVYYRGEIEPMIPYDLFFAVQKKLNGAGSEMIREIENEIFAIS